MTPDVAQQWPVMTIGELASADEGAIAIGPFGSSMKADTYTATGVPVVRGNNLTGRPGFFGEFVFVPEELAARFPRCVVGPGDLVFPHRGAIGQVGLVIEQGFDQWMLSTSMMKLRPDPEKLDSQFAFYFFRSTLGRHQLLKNASQVGTPGIGQPLASLRACELALPPLEQQHAIASVLGALDDKIEQNRRTARTLERLARAIFRAWFVDFEPVKAKAAGATAFPSMPQPVFDALPTRFTDSEIGPLPEGWHVKAFGELLELQYGKALKADNRQPGSIPVYGSNGQVGWHNEAIAPGPGIVVGRKGNPGTITWSQGPFFPIDTTFFVQLKDARASLPLLFHQLEAADLSRLAADSAVPGVNRNMIYAERCVVPDEAILAAFDRLVIELWELRKVLAQESSTLAEMRDYLLPKLLSGDVRVPASHGEGEEPV